MHAYSSIHVIWNTYVYISTPTSCIFFTFFLQLWHESHYFWIIDFQVPFPLFKILFIPSPGSLFLTTWLNHFVLVILILCFYSCNCIDKKRVNCVYPARPEFASAFYLSSNPDSKPLLRCPVLLLPVSHLQHERTQLTSKQWWEVNNDDAHDGSQILLPPRHPLLVPFLRHRRPNPPGRSTVHWTFSTRTLRHPQRPHHSPTDQTHQDLLHTGHSRSTLGLLWRPRPTQFKSLPRAYF